MKEFLPVNISTAATTSVVATGINCEVHTINFPKNTAGTVKLVKAGTAISYADFPVATVAGTYILDAVCSNGLDIVTSATDAVIATYTKL